MPHFIIRATDGSHVSAEIHPDCPHAFLDAMQGFEGKDADVLADDVYAFSVQLDARGVWSIFQRDHNDGQPGPVLP